MNRGKPTVVRVAGLCPVYVLLVDFVIDECDWMVKMIFKEAWEIWLFGRKSARFYLGMYLGLDCSVIKSSLLYFLGRKKGRMWERFEYVFDCITWLKCLKKWIKNKGDIVKKKT